MEETCRMETPVCSRFWRSICMFFCICLLLRLPSATVCAAATGQKTGVTFSALNDKAVFIKQSQTKLCTLAAATMMVRRAAMLSGNTNWQDITETSVRKDAWVEKTGLKWDFETAGIKVSHERLTSADELAGLLEKHPEGIAIYNAGKPHAILITDYTDGIFYCSDPSKTEPSGRYPVSEASITVASAGWYWYVKSPTNLTVDMDQDPLDQDPESGDRYHGIQLNGNQNGSQNGNQTDGSYENGSQAKEDQTIDTITPEEEKSYQAGGLTYRILNEKAKAAACTGQVKAGTTVNVPGTVKLNGIKYKVLQIAEDAFQNNIKLKTVTVGAYVASIGQNAFSGCKKLSKIIIKSENLQKVGEKAFLGIHKQVQVQLTADLADSAKQTALVRTLTALLNGTSLPGTAAIKINGSQTA